jgi:hypothetical protein
MIKSQYHLISKIQSDIIATYSIISEKDCQIIRSKQIHKIHPYSNFDIIIIPFDHHLMVKWGVSNGESPKPCVSIVFGVPGRRKTSQVTCLGSFLASSLNGAPGLTKIGQNSERDWWSIHGGTMGLKNGTYNDGIEWWCIYIYRYEW